MCNRIWVFACSTLPITRQDIYVEIRELPKKEWGKPDQMSEDCNPLLKVHLSLSNSAHRDTAADTLSAREGERLDFISILQGHREERREREDVSWFHGTLYVVISTPAKMSWQLQTFFFPPQWTCSRQNANDYSTLCAVHPQPNNVNTLGFILIPCLQPNLQLDKLSSGLRSRIIHPISTCMFIYLTLPSDLHNSPKQTSGGKISMLLMYHPVLCSEETGIKRNSTAVVWNHGYIRGTVT